jgi:acetyl esterase
MPLDPELRPFVDPVNQLELVDLDTVDLVQGRAEMRAAAAAGVLGASVAAVEDMAAPGPRGDIPVRVYTPQGEPPFGVVVFFHGGGWCLGDCVTHDGLCRDLAAAGGALVVSVDYRLAPEHPFPAAVDDALAATRWAAAHAKALGGDPNRLAVAGDSAGGNLAAAVTHLARDAGGPALAFQLLLYPATDLRAATPSFEENGTGYGAPAGFIRWLIGQYASADDVLDPRASPLLAADFAGLPPAYVATGEYDPLRDEGEAYAERLAAAGVPVTLSRREGMAHGFMQWPVSGARRALEDAGRALRRALGPTESLSFRS